MSRGKNTILLVIVAALTAALTACLSPAKSAETLEGTEWVLVSLNSNSLVAGSNITLNFAEGKAAGYSGCNSYGGQYTATGDGSLQIPELAVTVMLCLMPEGVMQQEEVYVKALSSAAAYRVVDDRLEIGDASAETILVFERKKDIRSIR